MSDELESAEKGMLCAACYDENPTKCPRCESKIGVGKMTARERFLVIGGGFGATALTIAVLAYAGGKHWADMGSVGDFFNSITSAFAFAALLAAIGFQGYEIRLQGQELRMQRHEIEQSVEQQKERAKQQASTATAQQRAADAIASANAVAARQAEIEALAQVALMYQRSQAHQGLKGFVKLPPLDQPDSSEKIDGGNTLIFAVQEASQRALRRCKALEQFASQLQG